MAELLVVILLSVHLILVDLAMAGPLLCVWLEWRETRRGDRAAGGVGLALARAVSWALLGGIATGALLLALRWGADSRYVDALAAVPRSRLWFGVGELFFSLGCMIVYARTWQRWSNWRLVHRALAVASASNLMIHFPALFVIVSLVSSRPELLAEGLASGDYRRLLVDPEVLSRVVHVWVAALAVAGATMMALAAKGGADADGQRIVQRGAGLALVAALVQIPSGLWLAVEMSEFERGRLVGGDALATSLFIGSMFLALGWMHFLSAVALGECDAKRVRRAFGVMLLVVVCMVATRTRTHQRSPRDATSRIADANALPDALETPIAIRPASLIR